VPKTYLVEIEKQILEVLHNINWLLEAHDSRAELLEVKGRKVILRYIGPCSHCRTDCLGVTLKEQMPDINLIYYKGKST
jgi:Fe-S cluster biogenesis protein NfuA